MDLAKPIELLQKEFDENKRALEKSVQLYANGEIDGITHNTHRENITRNLTSLREALMALTFLQSWNEPKQKD